MPTIERIKLEIDRFTTTKEHLQHLKDYFDGKHDILNRVVDGNKPNNKLVHNFAKYIVDEHAGYFMGKPVVYTGSKALLKKAQDLFNTNDEQEENSELAKQMGIFGRGCEILYLDDDVNIRFNKVSPVDMIIMYDQSIDPKIIGAIRLYTLESDDGKLKTDYAEVYDEEFVTTYNRTDFSIFKDSKPHMFGDVPVVDYPNNSDYCGDFTGEISLIDAYNLSRSNKTNDLDYFTDAYLKLMGMMGTEKEDIDKMRENRIMLLENSGDAGFLIKPSNVDDAKVQIKTLCDDIHKFSKTLDVSNEKFVGYASALAMGYKILDMEQIAVNKERKFKKGLQRRLKLICNHLNIKANNYIYTGIRMQFDRNLPVDVTAKIANALQLYGIISKETFLSLLPSGVVDDIQEELARIEAEKSPYSDTSFLEADPTAVVTPQPEVLPNDGQANTNQEGL